MTSPHRSESALVILGAGNAEYRAYGLHHISAAYPVILLDATPPAWTKAYTATQITTDLDDPEATAAALKRIGSQYRIGGVMTYTENHVGLAAQLAEGLGLPGANPAAVAACRDKALTRHRLAEAGIPSAQSYTADSEQEAVRYAGMIGYPIVVKPRALGGSFGVRRVDTEAELRAGYQAAAQCTAPGLTGPSGVLIEEYLGGPEISVECLVQGPGEVSIAAVTRKELGPEPAFEEVGHSIDADDELLHDKDVRAMTTQALQAVGITHGAMHVEMRLTSNGPRIIEINARLGGDLIPHLVHLATGIDLPRAAADLAMGQAPDITATRHRAAAIRFLYPHIAGRLEGAGSTFVSPWLERLVWHHRPGAILTPPPHSTVIDRIAHLVVTGPDRTTCHRYLNTAAALTTVQIRPAAAHTVPPAA